MGVKDNIATVRKDVKTHAPNFFIYYFEKFPQHQNRFVNYKGQVPKSLTSNAIFPEHVGKVTTMLLDVMDRSGDPGALKADAQKLKSMPQHVELGLQEFQDLFTALVGYLGETLGGSCDKAGVEKAGKDIVAALKVAGFK